MIKLKKEEKKQKKYKNGEFKITTKISDLPQEEKRELLYECFDILLSKQNLLKNIDSRKKEEKN